MLTFKMAFISFFLTTLWPSVVWSLQPTGREMAAAFFKQRVVRHVCYLSCQGPFLNAQVARQFMALDMSMSVGSPESHLERLLTQWRTPVGVLADEDCEGLENDLEEASRSSLLDASHPWLVVGGDAARVDQLFGALNLSVDADITYADCYGLASELKGFKYYHRWDFHNLTFRAITVVLERPQHFSEDELLSSRFTPGVSSMTKVTAQLLHALATHHNFRFNLTIAGRWIGSPARNSVLTVTNSLFWREQDLSYTCLRATREWLQWVEPFFPPVTMLETKVYYLISDRGVGDYENRFTQPLSGGVWACAGAAGIACAILLATAATVERRPGAALYGVGSVLAAACQQGYEDGTSLAKIAFNSQSRQMAALVLGLTSMLIYNYYTSSVVSWLLSASPPTIASIEELIRSPYELIFEDIGYTRGWLADKGLYYYSGYKNPKEDELKDKKIFNVKRTLPLLQTTKAGVDLMRTGAYAYHSEPYTASQHLSQLPVKELCRLGSLQMMPPSPVYVMGQPRGPYRKFFTWSLLRLSERGHGVAGRGRVRGEVPPCPGSEPRALALGQAAPAFALLAQMAVLALVVLAVEIWYHRRQTRARAARGAGRDKKNIAKTQKLKEAEIKHLVTLK